MSEPRAFFLNFDAEEELSRPAGYSPSAAVLARFAPLAEKVSGLLAPGDALVTEAEPPGARAGFLGLCWCPTPRALRLLRRAGARLPPVPSVEVLRATNHRRFSAELGQTLPGACYALTMDDVLTTMAGPSPTGQWLLKRPFGFAGRGRIKLHPERPGDLSHARSWIEASIRSGEGLQVEPLVERAGDFALHGFVKQSGSLVLGEPTRQTCDATGAWSGSVRAAPGDLDPDEEIALFDQARLAAAALHQAGYFGPFGIDGFRWIDSAGQRRWNARSEINARYSMGWAIGMGDRRPDRD